MTTLPELAVDRRGAVLWLTVQRQVRRNALGPGVLSGRARVTSVPLHHLLRHRNLNELCLTGTSLPSEQALAQGPVNRVDADLAMDLEQAVDFREKRRSQWTGR